jgi:uncharacterized membrane protein YphA (DoxX/SURF4 family)
VADCQRDDRERRVLRAAGGELAAVGDEQVLDVVRLPNGGDAAILYCFVFLYFAVSGGGPWSIDEMRRPTSMSTS